jgi:Flp pilus assembly protein TadD
VLLNQLRDLDASEIEERARLERETADTLRRIDVARRSAPPPQSTFTEVRRGRGASDGTLRGFLWGSGSTAAIALLAYFVMQNAKPKEEQPQPGAQQPPMAQAQQPSTDPVVLQLEAGVKQQPENLELRKELAKAYLERDNMMGVFEQTQYVLGKQPNDARALTYGAIVRTAMGQADAATKMLQQATVSDPTLLDAWVAMAWVNMQLGKIEAADAAIAQAKKQHPEESMRLDQMLAQMKSAAREAANQQQMPANHPAVDGAPVAAGPLPGAAGAPAAASNDPKRIEVQLTISPAARARVANGVIFVIARAAGVTAGPPVAAKRFALADLSGPITISSADSMMGQPLPDRVRIDVRLDSDGDPITRPATDPAASQDNVAAGSTVSLVLK